MQRIRVGLNGFGRIGRAFARIVASQTSGQIELVAINTASSKPEMLAHLLKYDSVYRTFPKKVYSQEKAIVVDGQTIACYNERDPALIPWNDHKVDVVIDCTGVFKTTEDLLKHKRGSVKKVILSAPAKDDTPHIVLGVNDEDFDFAKTDVISNASCTTNCAAPMFKVLQDSFGIESGFLTTTHAYTSSQMILDNASSEYTRSRAAGLSIIPTTTGAAKAVIKTIPELEGKIDGMALRVPVPVGSFTDISCQLSKKTTVEEIHKAFELAAQEKMVGILAVEKIALVSSDYIGSPFSCTIDTNYTKVINGTFVKVFGWYDNEWGYSNRLFDLVAKLSAVV